MIRLFLADGRRIHVNPTAIAYLEQLPEVEGKDDKDQPRTKIVLTTGDAVMVRQGPGQILVAAGLAAPRGKKDGKESGEHEAEEADE